MVLYRNSLFSIEKRMLGEDLNDSYENLKREGKDRARFFSAVHSDRTRDSGQKMIEGSFLWTSENISSAWEWQGIALGCSVWLWNLHHWRESAEKKKPSDPEKPVLYGPFWAKGLDWVTPRGPFRLHHLGGSGRDNWMI